MSTPSEDALKAELDAGNLRTGNFVRNSENANIATSLKQLYVDETSKLQSSDEAVINQPTSTDPLFDLRGTGTNGVLTQTLVGGADVTTATKAGFVRVQVTDAGNGVTDGFYYVQLFTLA